MATDDVASMAPGAVAGARKAEGEEDEDRRVDDH
jgi:hypothetical protein